MFELHPYELIIRLLPSWFLASLGLVGVALWVVVFLRRHAGFCLTGYDALIIAAPLLMWSGFDLVLIFFSGDPLRSVAMSRLARFFAKAVWAGIAVRQLHKRV